MNGLAERMWQEARKIAFSLCNNARLGWPFFHRALMYACHIMDVLPIKGCIGYHMGEAKQRCPSAMWFKDKDDTKIGNFRVFGCPVVAKVYVRQTLPDAK